MGDLTDAVFAANIRTNVNTFRQNLQIEYVARLASMLREKTKTPMIMWLSRPPCNNLQNIKRMMEGRAAGMPESRARYQARSVTLVNGCPGSLKRAFFSSLQPRVTFTNGDRAFFWHWS